MRRHRRSRSPLSAGQYTGTLYNATTLTRTAGGVTTTVSATLDDPQPYAFAVVKGQATSLTLTTRSKGSATSSSSTGTLTTSLQVDAGTTASTHAAASGAASVTSVLNGPTSTNSALTYMGSLPVSYSITMHLTSPFAANVDSACASGTATVTTTPGDAGVDSNVTALFDEASGGNLSFCLYDANGRPGSVELYISRYGLPQTPQMIAALGADGGATGESFNLLLIGQPATPLYNGTTASLSQPGQPLTMPVTNLAAVYEPNNTYVGAYSAAGTPGTVTLQLLP